jgi:thiamine-monophosphate kinase
MARKGADPGDLVCVTGDIGKGGAGLFALKNDIPDKLELVRPLFEPMPRLKEGMALASSKTVSSSMDLSDGLAYSLHLLKEINGCGFEIEMEKIPTSNEVTKVVNQLDRKRSVKAKKGFTLYSGGDYELIISVKRGKIRQAVNSVKSVGGKLTPIGKVTKENKVVLIEGGKRSQIKNIGYEHFSGKNKTRVK